MGGMVLETNMNEIVAQIEAQNRLEKSEVRKQVCSGPEWVQGGTHACVEVAWVGCDTGWACVCWVSFCFSESLGGGSHSVCLGLSTLEVQYKH